MTARRYFRYVTERLIDNAPAIAEPASTSRRRAEEDGRPWANSVRISML
jgi:hypothetical protein